MLPADVTDLLPQKTPFKMVDLLHFADEEKVITTFLIREDNILAEQGYLTEGGMIENMAQSAAAGTGYYFALQKKEIPIGYIGAVKNVKIFDRPGVGCEIRTELLIINKIGNASIVAGKIFSGKELLGSCELTIFVQQT